MNEIGVGDKHTKATSERLGNVNEKSLFCERNSLNERREVNGNFQFCRQECETELAHYGASIETPTKAIELEYRTIN